MNQALRMCMWLEEKLPEIEAKGLAIREDHGQTIFSTLRADGGISNEFVLWLAPKGTENYDHFRWVPIVLRPCDTAESMIEKIDLATRLILS